MNGLITCEGFLNEVVETISKTGYKAFISLNRFHIQTNYELGEVIVINQKNTVGGKSIVDILSKAINQIIAVAKVYSLQNLWRMRQFYLEYKNKPDLLELKKQKV